MKLFLLKRKDGGSGCWDITVAEIVAADTTEEALELSCIESEIDITEIGDALPAIEKGVILDDYKNG